MTSFDAVRRAARTLGIRKAGHAGTLDPFATGVLPVAVGEATKAIRYLHLVDKTYCATVRFGVLTDTLDVAGKVLRTDDSPPPPVEAVTAALNSFIGEIVQRPPAFSAVKINGKRAYELARGGETVEPAPRKVKIHEAKLVSLDGPDAEIELRCGAGMYVRALARDLAERLGTCGTVWALTRTAYGPFAVDDAVDPAKASQSALKPTTTALGSMRVEVVPPDVESRVRQGAHIFDSFFDRAGMKRPRPRERFGLVDAASRLIAVIIAPPSFPSGRCEIERVFDEK
ncbi:MAG: tRNA pseudouridine(55) synthase TruB [Deltaproteobacteria bacterium]|nr:tRNA pseudouridine(55) synthase TruB [Deltaproteobacteria bacterium]